MQGCRALGYALNSDAVPGSAIAEAAHQVVLGLPVTPIKKSVSRTVGRTVLDQGPRLLGQKELALATYRKALELDPSMSSAVQPVKELEQEQPR